MTYNSYDSTVSQGLVIIDFYADWCGPCKRLSPIYSEVAQEFAGQATFVKVNVDNEPGLSKKFGITSLPTLIMLRDGREISRRGPCNKMELKAWIASEVRKG
jgi:thioredoxin 1